MICRSTKARWWYTKQIDACGLNDEIKKSKHLRQCSLHNFSLELEKAHRYNLESDERERKKAQRTSTNTGARPKGAMAAQPMGAMVNAELAAKLAKRNLVDNVEAQMERGTLLKERRQRPTGAST